MVIKRDTVRLVTLLPELYKLFKYLGVSSQRPKVSLIGIDQGREGGVYIEKIVGIENLRSFGETRRTPPRFAEAAFGLE